MRLDQEAFTRGMWPEALVAALATLSVAWPLTGLLREDTWLLPAVLMVALVAVSGSVLRTLNAPPTVVALGQLFLGLGALAAAYLRDTLWRSVLPTRETLEQVGSLLAQAGTVLQTYAAPAPTTQGVTFLVVAVLTLTAVSVDSMGVTGRAPASAGIPLAAGFLVSVSNTGAAMEPWYFLLVAAMWLLMIAQQGRRVTVAWPSMNRRESRGSSDVSQGPRTQTGLAQIAGVLSLVIAVLGAAALPHLPPTFFGDGLARNPDARGGGSDVGDVAFTETMDPAQDLRNQSQAPVLRYRSNAATVEPLRVTATQLFEDGRWVAPQRTPGDLLAPNAPLPPPPGLGEDVPVTPAQVEVQGNELSPPHIAAPSPLTGLRLQGGAYRFSPDDSTVVLLDPTSEYQADYLTLASGAELPAGVGDTAADPAAFEQELLALDPASQESVSALSQEVVGGEENALQAAILIQDHFRTSGGYTYSLELADAAEAGADDPIGGFLETQQGYCVQFATAMVMMARHEGIPARMAVGFLPGTAQPDGSREVVASDAHTWPELWIDGLGWTRFEPTPGLRAGTPPSYARAETDPDDVAEATQEVPEEVPPPVEPPQEAPQPQDRTWLDDLADLLPALGRGLVALLVLALVLTLLPIIGRRYRDSGVRSATSARESVEGHWRALTLSLADLGIEEPPPRSPRTMRRHYIAGTALAAGGEQALERLTRALERARYADSLDLSEAEVDQMGEDVRTVVADVRQTSPWNLRANAALIPRSGLSGVVEGTRSLVRR